MKTPRVVAVIPARKASTRFPNKPLAPILGKPLIQWVWEGAKESTLITKVIVATDDESIYKKAQHFGAEVVMTRTDHISGTDRVAEVSLKEEADWFINLQGDEPLIRGSILDEIVKGLRPEYGMATIATPLRNQNELYQPDIVKVSIDSNGKALGFFRTVDENEKNQWSHQHVGLYAYSPETLQRLVKLPPSEGEKRERLEQLRALENGIAIQVLTLNFESIGVDTPGDVPRAERALADRATTISK
jgi:3-deoxy-manno-octulosonate cytidylyltransferase (CMP-KDO synthetase)